MKRFLPVLLLLAASIAQASTITFTWVPVTTYTDGTSIPTTVAITYEIMQGPSGGVTKVLDSNIAAPGVKETLNLANGNCFELYAVVGGILSPPSAPFCLTETPSAATSFQGKVSS